MILAFNVETLSNGEAINNSSSVLHRKKRSSDSKSEGSVYPYNMSCSDTVLINVGRFHNDFEIVTSQERTHIHFDTRRSVSTAR